MRRVHVIVSGRVQGVGFRWHIQRGANRIGLTGWVRNRPDGTVEAEAEGSGQSVDEWLVWLAGGPPGARVENVFVNDVDPSGGSGFDIRFHE